MRFDNSMSSEVAAKRGEMKDFVCGASLAHLAKRHGEKLQSLNLAGCEQLTDEAVKAPMKVAIPQGRPRRRSRPLRTRRPRRPS